MALDPKLVVWLVATCMAAISLARLMRTRQNSLLLKLHQYVKEQREWSKKKAKAALLARKLAHEKAEYEAENSLNLDDPDYDRYDKYASSAAAVGTPQQQSAQKAA